MGSHPSPAAAGETKVGTGALRVRTPSPGAQAAEVFAVLGLFIALYWVLGVRVRDPVAAGLYVAGSAALLAWALWYSPVRVHGDRLAARGIGPARNLFVRTDNLGRALALFGGAAAATVAALTAFALWRDPQALAKVSWRVFGLKLALYGTWAFVQDAVLFSFCLVRLAAALSARAGAAAPWLASLLLALMFAAAHLPNAPLALVAVPAAFIMGVLFLRTPNLVAAALGHAVVGTVLHQVVRLPMRSGPFHARPDLYPSRELLPWIKALVGDAW